MIISDLELFYILYPNSKIIGVTGTNGKTTTVLLIKTILDTLYKVHLGGNIGIPLFDLMSEVNFENEIILIECSSYMLKDTYLFHPNIFLVTNIYPNHLDHHLNFKDYVEAKLKTIKRMKNNDILIYHHDLKDYQQITEFQGNKQEVDDKNNRVLEIKNNDIFYQGHLLKYLKGYHNFINLKLALEVGKEFKINLDSIIDNLVNFKAPSFRLEKIFDSDKVKIYNDSKSTNFLSLIRSLEFFKDDKSSIHLILGGLKRKEDWYELKNYLCNLKCVYVYGENRYAIKKVLDENKQKNFIFETLEETINVLQINNNETNIILFSPGAPSTDQYKNYIERGIKFNEYILKKVRLI